MITVTDAAVEQVKKIMTEDPEAKGAYLRVQVVGGGCSGMSYKLGFDKEKTDKDKTFDLDGFQMVVDSKSYLFLAGTTLDFSSGLNGKGFEFNNPNATRTCGCGSSFSA